MFIKLFFFLAAGAFLWAVVGSSRVVYQPRYAPEVTPTELGLPWQPLRLETQDRISIDGWLIRRSVAEGVLLLLHGFGTCKADLLDVVRAFYERLPYHLLLIDFRGHGASGGGRLSFGQKELLDVKAALDFLSADPVMGELPVGLYGISMGGAIGLIAAAWFSQIQAVVADSAYADFGRTLARTQWLAYHIPRLPLGQMVIWATEIRLGCRLSELSPVNFIGRISPRPVFVIHGMLDLRILPEEGRRLFEAAGQPKSLWLTPQAEHVASFYLHREEYLSKIGQFFQDALHGKA